MRDVPSLALAALVVFTPPAFADGARRDIREPAAQAPIETLAAANAGARQSPAREGFVEARHIFAYRPGALYELYADPNFVSVILLEPGERLVSIAAGDTSRWMVSEVEAERGVDSRAVVLVKPSAPGLRTNIVLVSDRRTYLIEAASHSGRAYSAEIAWSYPQSPMATESEPTVAALNFNYRIRAVRGRAPAWTPVRAFDDGRRTFIEFPETIAASDMPPLFVITGEGAELANYRIAGARMIVERIFEHAELRLGTRAPVIVRIERGPPHARALRLGRGGRR